MLLAVLVAALGLRLVVAPGGLGLPTSGDVLQLRVDRALAAVVVGAALAGAGVALQAMLRNPLASPDLLGMSAGAVLAVTVVQAVAPGQGREAPAALAGAVGALGLVLLLGRRRGAIEPITLILVGVALAIGLASLAAAVQAMLPPDARPEGAWLFGSIIDDLAPWQRWGGLAIAIAGVAWIAARARALDAASMGEDESRSAGVPLERLRLEMVLVAGVLTAVAVLLAGPIAFLGLVCPHLARLTLGPRHLPLVIGAAAAGATLMLLADAGSRALPLQAGRLPTGVVVAVLAAPALVLILRAEATRPG